MWQGPQGSQLQHGPQVPPQQPVSSSNVNDKSTIVTFVTIDYRAEGNGMLWAETGDPPPAQNISHHSGAESALPAAYFELGQSPALEAKGANSFHKVRSQSLVSQLCDLLQASGLGLLIPGQGGTDWMD